MERCSDCEVIRATMNDATWWSIPGQFIQQHADRLALLTKEAYKAFLPAWMCEAVSSPTGQVAALVMANLKEGRFASNFSDQESYALIQVAKWIAEKNGFGPDDPEIMQKWGKHGN